MTSTLSERIDVAESEGGSKNYINEEIKPLSNYGENCNCDEALPYLQAMEDMMIIRTICLKCGGQMEDEN